MPVFTPAQLVILDESLEREVQRLKIERIDTKQTYEKFNPDHPARKLCCTLIHKIDNRLGEIGELRDQLNIKLEVEVKATKPKVKKAKPTEVVVTA